MKNIIIGLIFISCAWSQITQAQENSPKKIPFSITLSHHEGFFYKHRPSIADLPDALVQGFEINLKRITYGEKHWEQLYKYPQFGLTFVYLNNGIPLLGHSFMAVPYFSIPIFRAGKHSMFFDIGIGASYVTKKYSDDTLNTLISSNINFGVLARVNYNFKLTENLKLDISANFLHNSNGGGNRPNLGINTPTLSAGLQYFFNTDAIKYRQDSIPKAKKRPVFSASYGFGYKTVEYRNRPYNSYFCHNVSLIAGYQLTRRSVPTIGIDWLYDLSLEGRIGDLGQSDRGPDGVDEYRRTNQLLRNTRIGAHIGHELLVTNKLNMIFQFGFFVYNPYKIDGTVYHRLGLRYMITKNVFAAWYLKTFYARADNWELTVGIRL